MTKPEVDPHAFGDVAYLSIQLYSDHPEVYRMADLIATAITEDKAKKHHEKYIKVSRKFVASLWGNETDLFRWSTKTSNYGKKRKQVWLGSATLSVFLKMKEMGYINFIAKAIPPEMAKDGKGKSAIYCRTQKFKQEMATLSFSDVVLDPELDRITLRDEEGIVIPISDQTKREVWFKRTLEIIEAHRNVLLNEPIVKADGQTMWSTQKCYFRRFKGGFNKTGRFYSGFINWPKKERLQIRFKDNEPAFSLDLSSLHPYLLLRYFHRQDMYHPKSDTSVQEPYGVPEFDHLPREVHKKAVSILLNSETIDMATRALYNTYYWDQENAEIKIKTYKGKQNRYGIKAFPGNKKEALNYINAFKLHHPLLADHVCSGLGNILQLIDSDVMLMMMESTSRIGIPILPVHDEVIFPCRDLQQVIEALIFAVRSMLPDGRLLLHQHGFEGVLLGDPSDFGVLPVKISYFLNGEVIKKKLNIDLEYRWWEDTEDQTQEQLTIEHIG